MEWAKSRARAARYREEVNIVQEEMRRTIRFLEWKTKQWRERGDAKQRAGELDPEYASGLQAYAARQAAICDGQRRLFLQQWSGVDEMVARAERECTDPDLYYERQQKDLEDDTGTKAKRMRLDSGGT